MAVNNFNGYDSFVIENLVRNTLNTRLNLSNYVTLDTSLQENEGLTKKIHVYYLDPDSAVDTLKRGEGNSHFISSKYYSKEYRVLRDQCCVQYYDEDAGADSTWVESSIKMAGEQMASKVNTDAIEQFLESDSLVPVTAWNAEAFSKMISAYTSIHENTEGLFFIANIGLDAVIRKMGLDYLSYNERFLATGASYGIFGIPCYLTKILPANTVVLATKEAVRNIVKFALNVEQKRDPDTRLNQIFISRMGITALIHADRCFVGGFEQGTPVAITTATKETSVIAGTALDGAVVEVFVNGKLVGKATASSGFSITMTEGELAVGDVVKVVAKKEGYLKSIDTAEVSA